MNPSSNNHTYSEGDSVYVTSVRQKGTILKVTKPGHYLVQLKNMQITCKEENLQAHTTAKKKSEKKKRVAPVKVSTGSLKGIHSIDLHAMRVEPALELVESTINELILKRKSQLEIVHGIGSGKIKSAVIAYLENSDVVVEFNQKPFNQGAVLVTLRVK